MKAKGFFFVFIALFLASQAFAGWVIEEESGCAWFEEKIEEVKYFQKNWVKTWDPYPSGDPDIYDLDKGVIYHVERDRKIYWGGTPEEINKGIDEGMKLAFEEALKQLPPEERQAYREAMKEIEAERDAPEKKVKVKVKETSEKATIAGYTGQKYQIWIDGKLKEELWISTAISIKDEIDLKKFGDLRRRESGFEEGIARSYRSSPEYIGLMEKGYPVKLIKYDKKGEKWSVTEVTKVKKKQIPDSELKVLKGYRRMSIKEISREMAELGF